MFGSPNIPGNLKYELKINMGVHEIDRRDDKTRRDNTAKKKKRRNGDGRRTVDRQRIITRPRGAVAKPAH